MDEIKRLTSSWTDSDGAKVKAAAAAPAPFSDSLGASERVPRVAGYGGSDPDPAADTGASVPGIQTSAGESPCAGEGAAAPGGAEPWSADPVDRACEGLEPGDPWAVGCSGGGGCEG